MVMRTSNLYSMNIEQLKEQLKIDEGVVYEIYNDHLGYPTFGIGHLVIEGDPELGLRLALLSQRAVLTNASKKM